MVENGHDGHDHSEHGHGGHSHSHDVSGISGVRLMAVMLLNFIITAAEIAGGVVSGSLSLVSDALHNLSDAISVIISYYALRISARKNDVKRTFGYRRASIMAALVNSSVLVGISVFLFKEAYDKFVHPQAVNGSLVIWVALISLVANFASMLMLKKGSHGNMNIKSTYVHLLSDTLSSLGVIVAGILIWLFKVYWVDPLLTVIISAYILVECAGIMRKAVNILMQGTPEGIEIDEVVADLKASGDVENIHHVHIWCLDENNIHFEAHVYVKDMLVSKSQELSGKMEHMLNEKFGISHVTLQFEYDCCGDSGVINGECTKSNTSLQDEKNHSQ
jgi:cobalt-zinc-cadmium efflux system protein